MDTAAVFLAAERNGKLSVKEYEHLTTEITALLNGIKTPRIRAVLHPRPIPYPNYSIQQDEYQREQITTGQNRRNTQMLFPANMIPLRFYHKTTGDKIAGLVDEYVNIGNMEIVFVSTEDYMLDPTNPEWDGFTRIPSKNINTVALAAMGLEQIVKAHLTDFLNNEDRSADILVSFYAKDKSIMTTSEIIIAIDIVIL